MSSTTVLQQAPLDPLISKWIATFQKSTKPLAFTGVHKELPSAQSIRYMLGTELKDRLRHPHKINQGDSPLCGPSAFLYVLAVHNQKAYARYIMDLCDHGEATIGKLRIKPSLACRTSPPAEVHMSGCDWVGLASLRDSENSFMSVTPYALSMSGITMPETLASWFRLAGYDPVQNRTNTWFDKSLKSLVEADRLASSAQQAVALFINAKFLGAGWNLVPDHWVVLTSRIKVDGKSVSSALNDLKKAQATAKTAGEPIAPRSRRITALKQPDNEAVDAVMSRKISFTVYTWGDDATKINWMRPQLTLGDFLGCYYGFVSAKPGLVNTAPISHKPQHLLPGQNLE